MRLGWCEAIGLEARNLVTVHQTHGDAVALATRGDAGRGGLPDSEPLANADAIITADVGVALMTLHADCQPLLLCDPVVPVVAIVHAGWRGTVAGIAASVVRQLTMNHRAVPERMIAYLGPTNRGCCYQVGDEVAAAWLRYDPANAANALRFMADRWHFEVAAANRWTLLREGLLPQHIESSDVCTQCESDEWFSHRAQGPLTGRFGAVIGLR
jgi:YfiH family protein